ncbi:hypothetical protein D9M71_513940 [compost metagenome]
MYQALFHGFGRQRVPVLQLLPGRRLVQFEVADARFGALGDLCQQRLEMRPPAVDAGRREQIGGIADFAEQPAAGVFGGVQRQVAIHRAHHRRQGLHA